MKLRSIVSHGFAFLLPPTIVGVLCTLSVVKDVMMHREPKPVGSTRQNRMGDPLPEPPARDARPLALIVLSNQGTSALDVLATAEVLGRSGLWQVMTAAPERRLSATTAAVSILPDFSLQTAPDADLLVLPGVVDPNYPPLLEAVRAKGPKAHLVLAPGEGVRLAGLGGLLTGRNATGHIVSMQKLEQEAQGRIRFAKNLRVVTDGPLISSAGGSGAVDAALSAVAARAGEERARSLARELGWKWQPGPRTTPPPSGRDYARLLLNAGFDWGRRYVGVLLTPGISELGVGAWLETFPRSLSAQATTLAPQRSLIRTAHGLTLVPSETLPEAAPPDVIVASPEAGLPPLVESWSRDLGIPVERLPASPGPSLDRALTVLGEQDSPEVAHSVARLLEHPSPASLPDLPAGLSKKTAWLIFRILLLGSLGVFIFRSVVRGLLTRRPGAQAQAPASAG